MRGTGYLCLGGTEIANPNRTLTYLRNDSTSGFTVAGATSSCYCDALEDDDLQYGFTSPAGDDAPWYDPAIPASEEFLGVWAHTINLLSTASHDINRSGGVGAVLGALGLAHRVIQVQANLFASSSIGMAYGERWLSEVLTGSFCQAGCARDELEILPACPDVDGPEAEEYFRTLVNVGIVEGPSFGQIEGIADCKVQSADFQFVAALPWLFAPAETCELYLPTDGEDCCLVSTNSWPGDGTVTITLEAPETGGVQDIVITGKTTFNGECPWEEGMPCFRYEIAEMEEGGVLTIDGRRRELTFRDPAAKTLKAGFPYVEVERLFEWPDVPPCTDLCICVENGSGAALSATVDFYARSL